MRLLLVLSLICIFFINISFSRRHTLTLIDDSRSRVLCSQFAYGSQGSLAVELTNLPKEFLGDVGFSLEKSSSNDAGALSKLHGCWLDKSTDKRVLTLRLVKKWAVLQYLSDKSILVLSPNKEKSGFFRFEDEADEKSLKSFQPKVIQFLMDYSDVTEADADDISSEVLKAVTSDEVLRSDIVSMIKQSISEEVAISETFKRLLAARNAVEDEDSEKAPLERRKRSLDSLPEPDIANKLKLALNSSLVKEIKAVNSTAALAGNSTKVGKAKPADDKDKKDDKSEKKDPSADSKPVKEEVKPKEEEEPSPPKPQLSQLTLNTISTAVEAFVAEQLENHFRYIVKNGRVALNFTVAFTSASVAGAYDLVFHNCHDERVSATIHMVERNGDNFLSLGEQPLAALFFVFAVIYAILSTVWGLHLRCTKAPVFRIHHLMLAVVIVKSISLLLHAINYYVIGQHGVQEEGWAVMYYIAHMTRGFLLFFTILMIGAGWNFIKHVFSRREKQVFLIVIPLQVFANVATIVISESEQGARRFTLWQEIFTIVDLACCVGVLVPVVWSLRHLRAAATSDGKAAAALRQLRLFRHFYVLVVAYLYATRILLYLLRLAVPLRLVWTLQLFEQTITLAFFICVGVKFRPFDANPYLQLPLSPSAEEEEVVMQRFDVEHAWSQSGMAEGVTRIHRPQGLDAARENRRRRDDVLNRPLPGDEPDAADSDLMPLIRP